MRRKNFDLRYANAYHMDDMLRDMRRSIWRMKAGANPEDASMRMLIDKMEERFARLVDALMDGTNMMSQIGWECHFSSFRVLGRGRYV